MAQKGGFNPKNNTIKEEKHILNTTRQKGKILRWKIHHESLFSILIQVTEGEAKTKQTHTTL